MILIWWNIKKLYETSTSSCINVALDKLATPKQSKCLNIKCGVVPYKAHKIVSLHTAARGGIILFWVHMPKCNRKNVKE